MTPQQADAGRSVMRGTFKHKDVRRALQRANVPIDQLEGATNTLLQAEKEAGHIRYQKLDGQPADENDTWVKV